MKTKILFMVVLMCCFVGHIVAAEPERIPVIISDEKGEGEGNDRPRVYSLSTTNPVSVYITESGSLEVIFDCAPKAFDIVIKNSAGMIIYTKSVVTAINNELIINTSNYPTDTYTISFKDTKSRSTLKGNFTTD